MKKAFLYLLIATSAVISCKKEKTDEPVLEASPITIFVEEDAPTKALLNDAGLKTNGNKIHVIDLLTGFSGTASWMSGNKYIDDEIVYNGTQIWGYDSGRTYPWTSDGTHQFFAWLSYDTNMSLSADTFFGSSCFFHIKENTSCTFIVQKVLLVFFNSLSTFSGAVQLDGLL